MLIQSARTHHMIPYACTWGIFWIFIEIVHFFSRYLVVGSRYVFFSVSITCGATHAGRILFDTKRKRENSRVWPFEVGDAAVRQVASMNDSYGLTIVNCVWPQYNSISQLAGVRFFVTNSQLTQADDVFVYTSDRSRSMYYVDHLDPNLPFWGAVQGLLLLLLLLLLLQQLLLTLTLTLTPLLLLLLLLLLLYYTFCCIICSINNNSGVPWLFLRSTHATNSLSDGIYMQYSQ